MISYRITHKKTIMSFRLIFVLAALVSITAVAWADATNNNDTNKKGPCNKGERCDYGCCMQQQQCCSAGNGLCCTKNTVCCDVYCCPMGYICVPAGCINNTAGNNVTTAGTRAVKVFPFDY